MSRAREELAALGAPVSSQKKKKEMPLAADTARYYFNKKKYYFGYGRFNGSPGWMSRGCDTGGKFCVATIATWAITA